MTSHTNGDIREDGMVWCGSQWGRPETYERKKRKDRENDLVAKYLSISRGDFRSLTSLERAQARELYHNEASSNDGNSGFISDLTTSTSEDQAYWEQVKKETAELGNTAIQRKRAFAYIAQREDKKWCKTSWSARPWTRVQNGNTWAPPGERWQIVWKCLMDDPQDWEKRMLDKFAEHGELTSTPLKEILKEAA